MSTNRVSAFLSMYNMHKYMFGSVFFFFFIKLETRKVKVYVFSLSNK